MEDILSFVDWLKKHHKTTVKTIDNYILYYRYVRQAKRIAEYLLKKYETNLVSKNDSITEIAKKLGEKIIIKEID